MNKTYGLHIGFTGVDGAGKTTQMGLLYGWLRNRGINTIKYEETRKNRRGSMDNQNKEATVFDIVAVVITPDAVRDKLENNILEDLQATTSVRILWRKYWQIPNRDVVLTIYPRLLGRIFCSSLIKIMTLGPCLVLLVEGRDAFYALKEIKGKIRLDGEQINVTGLRLKYRHWLPEEIKNLGCQSQTALDKIFEIRLHTTDNLRETAIICSLCMNRAEIDTLEKTAPSLFVEISKIEAEI